MTDSDGRSRLEVDPAQFVPDVLKTGVPRQVAIVLSAVVTLAAFLFAVRLLGSATEVATPTLRDLFTSLVRGDTGALGSSWLVTYLLGNGSVVAALSLTLFAAGVVTLSQLFLMLAGSRLGAASIVLLVGGLEYLRRRQFSLREATSLGVLTFVLTISVFVPATVAGYLTLPWLQPGVARIAPSASVGLQPVAVFAGVPERVIGVFGPEIGFLAGIGLLYACLETFDRLLGAVDPSVLRRRGFKYLRRRWLSFLVGLVVTALTTSVAFSLGVVVAPYNRGYVKRREIVPYVLGANIGTYSDTILVAVVLGTEAGTIAVLGLVGWFLLATVFVLLAFEPYFEAVERVQDGVLESRQRFVAFLVGLALVPLAFALL